MSSANGDTGAPAVIRSLAKCPAFRIAENDTNYFALIFDAHGDHCNLAAVVEIFEPGGATPPNSHRQAHEMFFVLHGEGIARANGLSQSFRRGDAILVRPGTSHEIVNTGSGKLYCLTLMTPDEDFGSLIRRGIPVSLDADDYWVLTGIWPGRGDDEPLGRPSSDG